MSWSMGNPHLQSNIFPSPLVYCVPLRAPSSTARSRHTGGRKQPKADRQHGGGRQPYAVAVRSTGAQHLAAAQEQSPNFWVREQRLTGVLVAILPHSQDIPTVGMLRLARVLPDERIATPCD